MPLPRRARSGPPAHQVGVQRGHRGPTDRHQPLLSSLAAQQHRAGVGVDVVDVEPDRLGDPRAGGIQQLEQRPVPQRQRTVRLAVAAGTLQQGQHLVDGQALGQPPARRRRLDRAGHVEFGEPFGGGEAVQPADGDQRARRRHRRQRSRPGVRVAAAQRGQEVAHVGLGDLAQVVDAAQGEVLGVAPQIPPIGAQRVGGDATLDRQVVEVALQLVVEGRAECRHAWSFRRANAVGLSTQAASTGRNESKSPRAACAARIPLTAMALTISPRQRHPHRLVEGEPPHHQIGLFVVGIGPADVGQAGGEVHPHALVAEARRADEVDQDAPVLRGQPGLFLQFARGGDVWRLAAHVEQPRRQLPQPPAHRVAVLVDHDDVAVVVHRQDRPPRRSARRLHVWRCSRRASAPHRRAMRKSFRRRWFRSRRSRNRVQPRTSDFSRESSWSNCPTLSGCSAPFARCSGISTGNRSAAL